MTATIIGVVPNLRQRDFQLPDPDPIAYLPFRTDPRGFMNLLVRSAGDPNLMTPILREEVRAIDPDLPLFGIRTMDAALEQSRWTFRIFGSMFTIFALIALTLSAVGLYAVTAYAVSQRTQEIGLRMALGAQRDQVAWLFLRRSFIQLAIGLTLGVAGAFGVGALFSSTNLLVQNSGRDPITIGGIALLLALVAVAASVLPARRATRLDPMLGPAPRLAEAAALERSGEDGDGITVRVLREQSRHRAGDVCDRKTQTLQIARGRHAGNRPRKSAGAKRRALAIQPIDLAGISRHRPIELHRPHSRQRSRQPARAVLLARRDHDRSALVKAGNHIGERRFVIDVLSAQAEIDDIGASMAACSQAATSACPVAASSRSNTLIAKISASGAFSR